MNFLDFSCRRVQELMMLERVRATGLDEYNKVDGLLDLIRETRPRTVVEIGCNRGVSTECFLLYCGQVVAIDSWEGLWKRSGEEFKLNLSAYPHLVVIEGRSPDALNMLPSASFDMVYIDGDHDYASVKRDIEASRRLVRRGCWLAGHDYLPGVHSDVVRAVDELGLPIKSFKDSSWLIKLES